MLEGIVGIGVFIILAAIVLTIFLAPLLAVSLAIQVVLTAFRAIAARYRRRARSAPSGGPAPR